MFSVLLMMFVVSAMSARADSIRNIRGSERFVHLTPLTPTNKDLDQLEYSEDDVVTIVNDGSAVLTVREDDGSGTIVTLPPGASARLICVQDPCDSEDDWEGLSTIISDWVTDNTVTPSQFGSYSGLQFRWRRVGDQMEITGSLVTGTMGGSTASWSLPYSVDPDKVTITNTAGNPNPMVGRFATSSATANDDGGAVLVATGTSTSLLYFGPMSTTAASKITPAVGTSVSGNALTFSFFAKVPIEDWSSTRD